MDALDILKSARDLLSDEKRWTKGHYARDAQGRPTPPHAIDAVCWCPEGAIAKFSACAEDGTVNSIQVDKVLLGAFLALEATTNTDYVETDGAVFQSRLWPWNDAPERTHAEVLARFDDAIARLTAQKEETVP